MRFVHCDLGFYDHEAERVECAPNRCMRSVAIAENQGTMARAVPSGMSVAARRGQREVAIKLHALIPGRVMPARECIPEPSAIMRVRANVICCV